jgi:hypothetical protein
MTQESEVNFFNYIIIGIGECSSIVNKSIQFSLTEEDQERLRFLTIDYFREFTLSNALFRENEIVFPADKIIKSEEKSTETESQGVSINGWNFLKDSKYLFLKKYLIDFEEIKPIQKIIINKIKDQLDYRKARKLRILLHSSINSDQETGIKHLSEPGKSFFFSRNMFFSIWHALDRIAKDTHFEFEIIPIVTYRTALRNKNINRDELTETLESINKYLLNIKNEDKFCKAQLCYLIQDFSDKEHHFNIHEQITLLYLNILFLSQIGASIKKLFNKIGEAEKKFFSISVPTSRDAEEPNQFRSLGFSGTLVPYFTLRKLFAKCIVRAGLDAILQEYKKASSLTEESNSNTLIGEQFELQNYIVSLMDDKTLEDFLKSQKSENLSPDTNLNDLKDDEELYLPPEEPSYDRTSDRWKNLVLKDKEVDSIIKNIFSIPVESFTLKSISEKIENLKLKRSTEYISLYDNNWKVIFARLIPFWNELEEKIKKHALDTFFNEIEARNKSITTEIIHDLYGVSRVLCAGKNAFELEFQENELRKFGKKYLETSQDSHFSWLYLKNSLKNAQETLLGKIINEFRIKIGEIFQNIFYTADSAVDALKGLEKIIKQKLICIPFKGTRMLYCLIAFFIFGLATAPFFLDIHIPLIKIISKYIYDFSNYLTTLPTIGTLHLKIKNFDVTMGKILYFVLWIVIGFLCYIIIQKIYYYWKIQKLKNAYIKNFRDYKNRLEEFYTNIIELSVCMAQAKFFQNYQRTIQKIVKFLFDFNEKGQEYRDFIDQELYNQFGLQIGNKWAGHLNPNFFVNLKLSSENRENSIFYNLFTQEKKLFNELSSIFKDIKPSDKDLSEIKKDIFKFELDAEESLAIFLKEMDDQISNNLRFVESIDDLIERLAKEIKGDESISKIKHPEFIPLKNALSQEGEIRPVSNAEEEVADIHKMKNVDHLILNLYYTDNYISYDAVKNSVFFEEKLI